MSTWTTFEHVQALDEVAPESMASTVFSRRWVRDRGDGFFGAATIKFWCEDRWEQAGNPEADRPDWVSGGAEARYCVGQQVELIVCSDPEETGDGGIWHELRYRSSEAVFAAPMPDELVESVMKSFTAKHLTWDATEIYGGNRADIVDMLVEPITPEGWTKLMPLEVRRWIATNGWAWL